MASRYLDKNWDCLLTLAGTESNFMKTLFLRSYNVFARFRSLAIYKSFY